MAQYSYGLSCIKIKEFTDMSERTDVKDDPQILST